MPRKPKEVVYALDLAEDEECTVWRVCYFGETGRGEETRDAEHEDLVGGAGRVAASVAKHGRRRHRVRVVDVVVDDDDRKALETFFMVEHDTLLKNRQRMRDLLAHENRDFDHKYPDISLDDQPLNFQLNQVRSVAVKHDARVKAAGEAYKTRQAKGTLTLFTPKEEEALFKRIDADLAANEGVDEPLSRMLVAREAKDADGGCVITLDARTPFGRARELRDKYKELDAGAEVDRDTVSAELKSIGELTLYKLEEPDAYIQATIKIWLKDVHPNNALLVGKPLYAGSAADFFQVVWRRCGEYEEAELDKRVEGQELTKEHRGNPMTLCDHVDRAKAWREWARAHNGAMPKAHSDDSEETQLARERNNWSSSKQPFQPIYLIFLRDVAGFASGCLGRRGGGKNVCGVRSRIKRLLHSGMGFQEEGRSKMSSFCPECGNNDKAYQTLVDYTMGGAPDTGEFLQGIVNDVFTQERCDTLKTRHEAKRQEFLKRLDEQNAKKKAAKRTRGSSSTADAAEAVVEEAAEDAAPPSPETVDTAAAMEEE